MQQKLLCLFTAFILGITLTASGQTSGSAVDQSDASTQISSPGSMPNDTDRVAVTPSTTLIPSTGVSQTPPMMSMESIPRFKPGSNKTEITIPSLTIKNLHGPNISVTGFNGLFEYNIQSMTQNNMKWTITVANLQITNSIIPINGQISAVYVLDNINLETLNKILQILKRNKDVPRNSPQYQAAMDQVMALTPKLVAEGSNLVIHSVYSNADGRVVKDFKASYPKGAPLPTTMQELSKHAKATLDIQMSIPLFNQLLAQFSQLMSNTQSANNVMGGNLANNSNMPNMAGMFITQMLNSAITNGIIIKTDKDYIIHLSLDNGVLLINGKPIDGLQQKMRPAMPISPPVQNQVNPQTELN